METLFRQFFWLIFPIMFFAMGAYSQWLRYRKQKAWLEVIKTYAAQGKDPPAEILNALQSDREFGPGRAVDRMHRGQEWKGALVLGALSVAFVIGSQLFAGRGDGRAFLFVAAILGAIAMALVAMSILSRVIGKTDPNDR